MCCHGGGAAARRPAPVGGGRGWAVPAAPATRPPVATCPGNSWGNVCWALGDLDRGEATNPQQITTLSRLLTVFFLLIGLT